VADLIAAALRQNAGSLLVHRSTEQVACEHLPGRFVKRRRGDVAQGSMSSAGCADDHCDAECRRPGQAQGEPRPKTRTRSRPHVAACRHALAWCGLPGAVALQHHRTLLLRRPRAAAAGSCFRLLHTAPALLPPRLGRRRRSSGPVGGCARLPGASRASPARGSHSGATFPALRLVNACRGDYRRGPARTPDGRGPPGPWRGSLHGA
jgi:hypothetical protein